ncbi:50S ribosomal protein L40 [Burkholderia sp. AU33803]|nr:50S ribosomal protein L40 [Burkholderia sp. AU33803]PRD84579.1 50S ribosomal protein L40 [Burkholderia contaminans]
MQVRSIRIEIKCCASYQNPSNAQQFHAACKGIRPRQRRPAGSCAAPDRK